MDVGPELAPQIVALITSLVAYIVERAAQHVGETLDRRSKRWRVAKRQFEEFYTEAYRRFFRQAAYLADSEDVKRLLKSPEMADNLLRYACGEVARSQVAYIFQPPYDRLPSILDGLLKEGRPLATSIIINSLRRVEAKVDKLGTEQAKQTAILEELQRRSGLPSSVSDYLDGQITRPWEQHPAGALPAVPQVDKEFFDSIGQRLKQSAERMSRERGNLEEVDRELQEVESEIRSRRYEWAGDPGRSMASERAASACEAFAAVQRGTIRFEAGEYADAARLYERAGDRALAAGDTELAARVLYEKGAALGLVRKHREAEGAFRKSLELADTPRSRFNLGVALNEQVRWREALEEYRLALAGFRGLERAQPGSHREEVATTLDSLGNLLSYLGQGAEARECYEEALQIRRRLAEAEPGAHTADAAGTLNNLGNLLSRLGGRPGARKCYEEALAIYRGLAEAEPGAYLPYVAMALNNLGNLLRDLGERAEARKCYEEALAIYGQLAEAEPAAHLPDVAMAFNNLGTLLSDLGERAEARKCYEEALKIFGKLAEGEPGAFLERLHLVVRNVELFARTSGMSVEEWPALRESLAMVARLQGGRRRGFS